MLKSNKLEFALNYFLLSLLICGLLIITMKLIVFGWQLPNDHYFELLGLGFVELFALFLFYSGSVYILARQGYFKRMAEHVPASRVQAESFLAQDVPSVCILLPSYKEEIPVIRQSLYSSALQAYGNRRVVLLIDNPPDCPQLIETINLVHEINRVMKMQQQNICRALAAFKQRIEQGSNIASEKVFLASLYEEIAGWFEQQAQNYPQQDHTDHTFVELTFRQRALDLRSKKQQLINDEEITLEDITQAYPLFHLFDVEITCFERKKYFNFSHAANKSMNLNSYIGVLGKYFREGFSDNRLILQECAAGESEFHFPSGEYICVLDADSVLTYDYIARLICSMEQPQFAKTAVMQTPYSAFPNAPGILEKVAGATTDIQYMIHQGFTYFGASFWVGANAIIRKSALDEIAQHKLENNFLISRYIQDRTVIEDTESSIDLAVKGWQIYNFPERLSYSATPPDFGALLIQRKRWANGGLIILPKAVSYLLKSRFSWASIKEFFFRFHYLISIPAFLTSYGLVLLSPISLSQFPLESALLTLPYLAVYSRDLKLMGYRCSDIFRVIALNTMLVPVNFAGVWQSIIQMSFGKHAKFFRTPKISGLTPIPIKYLIVFLLCLIFSLKQACSTTSLADSGTVFFLTYGLIRYLRLGDFFYKLANKLLPRRLGNSEDAIVPNLVSP